MSSTRDALLPKIAVLTTGGTIAGVPAQGLSYQAGPLAAQHLFDAIPNVHELACLSVEAHANVGSQDVDPNFWTAIANRVRELLLDDTVDAVVITHGTDTLEETAYFLHLATCAKKPVVLTGAMFPPHVPSADGPGNLYAAIATAASASAKSVGVCVVMDETVYDAVEIQKQRAQGLGAFCSRNHGPMGQLQQGTLRLCPGREYGNPALRGHFADVTLGEWPVVHILYAYAGVDSSLIQAVAGTKPQGVVVAGVGNGNAGAAMWEPLHGLASKGVAIVRSTRTGAGCVLRNIEVDDEAYGFIAAGSLSPAKSRVLLLLALKIKQDPDYLQCLFMGV